MAIPGIIFYIALSIAVIIPSFSRSETGKELELYLQIGGGVGVNTSGDDSNPIPTATLSAGIKNIVHLGQFSLRAELEGLLGREISNGPDGTFARNETLISTEAAFGSVWVDMNPIVNDRFTFSLGAGLGIARSHFDFANGTISFERTFTNLAVNAGGQIAYRISESIDLGIGVRYFNFGSRKQTEAVFRGAEISLPTPIRLSREGYRSLIFLRYNFGK